MSDFFEEEMFEARPGSRAGAEPRGARRAAAGASGRTRKREGGKDANGAAAATSRPHPANVAVAVARR